MSFNMNAWRDAVASPLGPKHAPTRHFLLTVSLYMNPAGECYPSQESIAVRMGVSLKHVGYCSKVAAHEGWVVVGVVAPMTGGGQGWRRYFYRATFPGHLDLSARLRLGVPARPP